MASIVRPVQIIDTTLRDGAQSPGIVFSRRQKIMLARLLDAAGVDEIEAGTPVMGPAERGDLAALLNLGLRCHVTGWCRAHFQDLRQAKRCGLAGIHLAVPVSDIQLAAMGRDRSWVMEQIRDLVKPAAGEFERVSVGAQDAMRAEACFLGEVAGAAAESGAGRLRLADTVGVAHPLQVAAIVTGLRAAAGAMAIEFHAHNDLGMATANAVTAAAAGADALSVTVNGLGERAGNAALEEVATALWRCGVNASRIHLEGLTGLCRTVAGFCRRPLPSSKPVVGEAIFVHESGIHCDGVIKDPATFEPFPPQRVGQAAARLQAGSHSGAAGIRHLLGRLGVDVDAATAASLRPAVQQAARRQGGRLSEADLLKIYRRVISASR